MQKPECLLLRRLPVEALLLVLEELPIQNQLVLSQTCYSLRRTYQLYSIAHPSQAQPFLIREKLDYLTCMARSMPDKWVCSVCVKLHPISEEDRPELPSSAAPCKALNWFQAYEKHDHHGFGLYTLSHRHVQLALKYLRLRYQDANKYSNKYKGYLQKLLAPHSTVFVSRPGMPTEKGQDWAIPQIADGRFLLASKWDYVDDKPSVELTPDRVGFLHVCAHQFVYQTKGLTLPWLVRLFGWLGCNQTELQRVHTRVGLLCRLLVTLVRTSARRAWYAESTRPEGSLHRGLAKTLKEAYEAEGQEISGSCHLCPTDYAVTLSPRHGIKVRAWKDLGPECSPLSRIWKANVVGLWSDDPHWFTYDHVPGSVRKRYETSGYVSKYYEELGNIANR